MGQTTETLQGERKKKKKLPPNTEATLVDWLAHLQPPHDLGAVILGALPRERRGDDPDRLEALCQPVHLTTSTKTKAIGYMRFRNNIYYSPERAQICLTRKHVTTPT